MKEDLKIFIDIVEKLLKDEISNPVAKPIAVDHIYEEIDIRLGDEGTVDEEFVATLSKLVLNTPKTASNLFFNQLFGGRRGKAVLGDLLAVVLNNSMYTYKVGGPQIIIEKEIIRNLAKKIGYHGESVDGTMAPGGSMTNLMGLLMARDKKDPNAKYDGISKKLIVYTSKESHYSTPKNVAFAGMGRNNIRFIDTDEQGRMLMMDLREKIEEDIANGCTPCMVNATTGTTVLCAFDPLREIGEICKEFDMWFHIDGALGGSVIFSKKYRYLADGSELSDSFSVNAHKLFSTPLSASFIIVKEKKRLYDSFSNDASYLYQTGENDYNPGKISLQCGRRNDALKFWTLWKSIGTSGLESIIDHQFDTAAKARGYVADHLDYTLYNAVDSISICFNYKNIDPKVICNELYDEGKLMVGYGSFNGQEFIRLVTVNGNIDFADLQNFFNIIERSY
ncbi:MAG: pyridoxal-dependent decarboxylase [Saprospiraceae bacterium]